MRLIADVGGTNARFALAGPEGLAGTQVLAVADYPDFSAALSAWSGAVRDEFPGGGITSAAIAAAGPRDGDTIALTNAPWRITAGEVSRMLGGVPVRLLNDLEAVALGLPVLAAGDAEAITEPRTGPEAAPDADAPLPMLAVNIGTGLGAAVAIPAEGRWIALATEAGHMSLTPATAAEDALLSAVRSAEDAFSGPGHVKLFGEGSGAVGPLRAEEARDEQRLYSRVLGRFLGDLVLATGSWGGVWLCGGVVADFDRNFERDEVLRAFRRKGAMAERMARVPIRRITLDAPALHALAAVPVP